MVPRVPFVGACLAGAALVLACAPALAHWSPDPAVNQPVCVQPDIQYFPVAVSDGAGGAIVVWNDQRTGSWVGRAQRLSYGGAPLWALNGVSLTATPVSEQPTGAIPDGAGGIIVASSDNGDIHAQRLDRNGNRLWGTTGVVVCAASGSQFAPRITGDAQGNCYITWLDSRGAFSEVYVQKLNSGGVVQWTMDGIAVTASATADQNWPSVIADGVGGAWLVWQQDLGAAADIRAQRIAGNGIRQQGSSGLTLCGDPSQQIEPDATTDGQGGIIVVWRDFRSLSSYQVYAARVTSAYAIPWTADGVPITNLASGVLQFPKVVSAGSGGVIAAWYDNRNPSNGSDVFAQRIDLAGAPQWIVNGIEIAGASGAQTLDGLAPDGIGGALVSWRDNRGSPSASDVYVQRLDAAGAELWTSNGVLAGSGPWNVETTLSLVSDGAGGAIVTWADFRNGERDVFSQRVDRIGLLGSQPNIASARDIPNDQGGNVKVSWDASPLDLFPNNSLWLYRVFRSAPPNAAQAALRRGARLARAEELTREPAGPTFITTGDELNTQYWEFLETVFSYQLPGYSFVAPTTGDSVPGSNPKTLFMIQAQDFSNHIWTSDPDSGYSVDNLGPAAPQMFTGAYQDGATHLHWDRNHEADLDGYYLYRGSSAGFVPGPGNRIASPPDTGYADAGPAGAYYKISAVDVHGNESPFTLLTPAGTVDVAAALGEPAEVWLARARPNPARDGASFEFGLPRESAVRLTIHDVQGRLTRELDRSTWPPGAHAVRWDGRDAEGRDAAAGVYLVRLEVDGLAKVGRVAVVR